MNPSIFRAKTFLSRNTLVSAAVALGALVACSSGTARDGFEATSTDSIEPAKPGTEAPGEAGPDASAPAAPAECERTEPSKACGVSPQCGCADGKTCDVVDGIGNARCVAAGSAPMGHPCGSTASCAAGLTCVFGTCHAFCKDPGQACDAPGTGACVQVMTTDGAAVPNLAVCRIACAPHDPSSCGGTTSEGTGVCNVDPDGNTECQTGGARAEGEECTPSDQCGPGLACVTAEEKSTCKRWCRLGEDDCADGTSCAGFAPEVNVRGVAYGSCM